MQKRISQLVLTIFSFCFTIVHAQDLNFYPHSVSEGLPSSQVHDIIQSDDGNLWFSTDHGMSCFDGYSFKNYTADDGLTDNVVFKLYKQTNGEIYASTFNKSVFSITSSPTPVFKAYPYNSILTAIPDYFVVNSLHKANDNSLFVGIINGTGYIHIDANGKVILNNIAVPDTVPSNIVLITEKNNTDFFYIQSKFSTTLTGNWTNRFTYKQKLQDCGGNYTQACYFKKHNKAIFSTREKIIIQSSAGDLVEVPVSFEPISMGVLNDNQFWVGFRYGGIAVYNLNGKKQQSFLVGKSVTKMFMDHEGGYWFATLSDGVFHSKSSVIKNFNPSASADNWIKEMSKDENGNIWIAYYNGNVSRLMGNTLTEVHQSVLKKPALVCYDKHAKQSYYFSDLKLFSADSKTLVFDLKGNHINMYAHSNDSILFSSYRGLMVYSKNKKYSITTQSRINDLCFYKGQFFMAGNAGLYTLRNQEIKKYTCKNDSLIQRIVEVECWTDKLVMATKGWGVLVLQDNVVYKIDNKQGLSGKIVNKVYIENDSVVWACTNNGLNRIVFKNKKVNRIDVISHHDGLISNEITDIEILNDTVWVGTREGLCYFPKSMLDKTTTTTTNYFLQINEFKVNDQSREKTSELSYNENRIEFGFKAISFFEFKPMEYRFKLQGLETEWNYTTSLSIRYTSLPPGHYVFMVQAKGKNASWALGQQAFSFTISPPFWQTLWFRLGSILLIVLLIYLFFRFRILSYNRDITRELMRLVLKRLTKKTNYVVFREQGKDIRIATDTICFIKSDGNYIEINTDTNRHVIRYKIGEFLDLVPDPLEYLRINRSYIIRIDKVQSKSKKDVTVCGEKLAVGETYLEQLSKIKF